MSADEKCNRGCFFVIERRIFHQACDLGLHPAIALLVLVRFSDGTNRRTKASVHAVEKHTEIGRSAARDAIHALARAGIVIPWGPRTLPRYTIASEGDLPDPRGTLSERRRSILGRATSGGALKPAERRLLGEMENEGWVQRLGTRYVALPRDSSEPIWLPNELIDGIAGAPSPVDRIKQTGKALALRLFIDLYTVHRLEEWRGVSPDVLKVCYDEVFRRQVGAVWVSGWKRASPAFVANLESDIVAPHVTGKGPERSASMLFEHLRKLEDLGLLTFVPHAVDNDNVAIYPCPQEFGRISSMILPAERELGELVRDAAIRMLAGDSRSLPHDALITIVPRHMDEAKLVGIARLHFRPKTAATAVWYSDLNQGCARWIDSIGTLHLGTGGIALTNTRRGHGASSPEEPQVVHDLDPDRGTARSA